VCRRMLLVLTYTIILLGNSEILLLFRCFSEFLDKSVPKNLYLMFGVPRAKKVENHWSSRTFKMDNVCSLGDYPINNFV